MRYIKLFFKEVVQLISIYSKVWNYYQSFFLLCIIYNLKSLINYFYVTNDKEKNEFVLKIKNLNQYYLKVIKLR